MNLWKKVNQAVHMSETRNLKLNMNEKRNLDQILNTELQYSLTVIPKLSEKQNVY
jgi:hypothetical protein